MSLDKAIEHNKEKRKSYYGAKAVDRTCRNNGSCSYCMNNRMHKHNKKMLPLKQLIEECLEELT